MYGKKKNLILFEQKGFFFSKQNHQIASHLKVLLPIFEFEIDYRSFNFCYVTFRQPMQSKSIFWDFSKS